MKKQFVATLATGLFFTGMTGMANAAYVQQLDIIDLLGEDAYSIGGTISWSHTYNFSETAPIKSASLTILADDVDPGENDIVYLLKPVANDPLNYERIALGELKQGKVYTDWEYKAGYGAYDGTEWVDGGYPNNLSNYTTTKFDFSQELIAQLFTYDVTSPYYYIDDATGAGLMKIPFSIQVEKAWGVEIEKSTLTVEGAPVPVPATVFLFGAGLAGLAGIVRRKKTSAV